MVIAAQVLGMDMTNMPPMMIMLQRARRPSTK